MQVNDGSDWTDLVWKAFRDEELYKRVLAAGYEEKNLQQLFEDLSRHVLSQNKGPASETQKAQPNNKKRKIEDVLDSNSQAVPKTISSRSITSIYSCADVSVQAPVRKKLNVSLLSDPTDMSSGTITLENSSTHQKEYELGAGDIDEVFCLPMPDKQARQANITLFPKFETADSSGGLAEPILFVLNDSAPTTGPAGALKAQGITEEDTYVTVTERALEEWLSAYGKKVTKPSEREFASSRPQPHRKGEKAYHVNAHRGSKEGYLFFLENGIVFGFKKPLAFFPFSSIESISYTSVLQRTFNLVISTVDPRDPTETKDVEFSMIDQEDFAGIDAYVKRHGLNDASMAAQRRAKAYNVNKVKKEDANGETNGGVEEDEQTELQKAEQQLQDEEDEQEEDYQVSGGESEGEGEDSDEEEEAYDDDEVEEVEGDDDDLEED